MKRIKSDETDRKIFEDSDCYKDDSESLYESETEEDEGDLVVVAKGATEPSLREGDFIASLERFGPISYVHIDKEKEQVLIEFEFEECAAKCVAEEEVQVGDITLDVSLHPEKRIIRNELETAIPQSILLLTITDILVSIDAKTIYEICRPQESLRRIKFLEPTKESTVEVLVEFDGVWTARNRKLDLNGADIYPGCCSLKAEFSCVPGFRITATSIYEWDRILQPDGPGSSISLSQKGSYLGIGSRAPKKLKTINMVAQLSKKTEQLNSLSPRNNACRLLSDRESGDRNRKEVKREKSRIADATRVSRPCVIAISGVDQRYTNCQNIFNLLVDYGCVRKVKFVISARNICLVEMGTEKQAETVLTYFQYGIQTPDVFLNFNRSNKDMLKHEDNPILLYDGTPSFCDYRDSLDQRISLKSTPKKKALPSERLYFFGIPEKMMDEEKIYEIFTSKGAEKPVECQLFGLEPGHRMGHGIVKFSTQEIASDILMKFNNISIEGDDTRKFQLKLSFAVSQLRKTLKPRSKGN